ncbi:hypothetical protein AAY24_10635 [Sedimenticola thiotaurini]|uniref:DUF192 domain-containing protein n=2 Tax=Sedimenticola thiotaurini TaxID=1543721 RepID=A0A0F7K3V7_9GAMM|nr:hypothetical protein AAY24_10635 [Sedimenticola thiotaurini]
MPRALLTETLMERTKGLLGKPPLEADQALWIQPCNSVHTFGMKSELDIVYLNHQGVVKKIVPALAPRRTSLCLGARSVIELQAGIINTNGITIGDRVEWIENNP